MVVLRGVVELGEVALILAAIETALDGSSGRLFQFMSWLGTGQCREGPSRWSIERRAFVQVWDSVASFWALLGPQRPLCLSGDVPVEPKARTALWSLREQSWRTEPFRPDSRC
jgi:hypothetical protein